MSPKDPVKPEETATKDAAAPAHTEKTFLDGIKELPTDVGNFVTKYYEEAKKSPAGQKAISMAEYAKKEGIELSEDGMKKATEFWDTYAPQGVKEAAAETGSFFGKNGFGLGAGILGILAGLMLGLGPIEAILIGLLGFALGGAIGDKDGLMGGLMGSLFGSKPPAPNSDDKMAKIGQAPAQQIAHGDSVPVKEDGIVQVVDPADKTAINSYDAKKHAAIFGVAKEIHLAVSNGHGGIAGEYTGKVNDSGKGFEVTEYTPFALDGKTPLQPIKKTATLVIDPKGNTNLMHKDLDAAREDGKKQVEAYEHRDTVKIERKPGNEISAALDKYKGYTVVLQGTVAIEDNKEHAVFTQAQLLDANNKPLTGKDGKPLSFELKETPSFVIHLNDMVDIKHGHIENAINSVGEKLVKEANTPQPENKSSGKANNNDTQLKALLGRDPLAGILPPTPKPWDLDFKSGVKPDLNYVYDPVKLFTPAPSPATLVRNDPKSKD